jgi:hypothetical protein
VSEQDPRVKRIHPSFTRRQVLLGGVALLSGCRSKGWGPTPSPSFAWNISGEAVESGRIVQRAVVHGGDEDTGRHGPVETEVFWATVGVGFYSLSGPWMARTRVAFHPAEAYPGHEPMEKDHAGSEFLKWNFGPSWGAEYPFDTAVTIHSVLTETKTRAVAVYDVEVRLRFIWNG